MNKTMIFAAAFISAAITTHSVASASSVSHLAGGLARIKSGTLTSKGYGYSVMQTGEAERAVNQNFTRDPEYDPQYSWDGGAGGGGGGAGGNGGGNADSDSDTGTAGGID